MHQEPGAHACGRKRSRAFRLGRYLTEYARKNLRKLRVAPLWDTETKMVDR